MGPVSLLMYFNSYLSSRLYHLIRPVASSSRRLMRLRLWTEFAFTIHTNPGACASSHPGASPSSLPPSSLPPSLPRSLLHLSSFRSGPTDRGGRRADDRLSVSGEICVWLASGRTGGTDGVRPPQPIYLLGEPGCCLPAPPPPSVRGTNAPPPPPRRRSHTSVCPPSFLPPLPRGVQLVSEGAK